MERVHLDINPKPANQKLRDDLSTMLANELAWDKRSDEVLYGSPTAADVREWYFVQDPIDELSDLTYGMVALTGQETLQHERSAHEFKKLLCQQKAAAILITAVGLRDDVPGTGALIYPAESIKQRAEAHQGRKIDTWYEPWEVSSSLLEGIEADETLEADDLSDLLIAGEMLMNASQNPTRFFVALKRNARTGEPELLRKGSEIEDEAIAHQLFTMSALKGSREGATPQERKIALSAAMQRAAYGIARNVVKRTPGEASQESRMNVYTILDDYMNTLELEFTGEDRLQVVLPKAEAKGLMHEAVWFLDSALFAEAAGAGCITIPAPSVCDRPSINHPKKNRAFDVALMNIRGVMRFQLKSGRPRFKKDYHPDVTVLEEENFLDFDQRRLTAKLNAYRAFIDSGYLSDEKAQAALRYALPTARYAFKSFYDHMGQEDSPFRYKTRTAHINDRYGISRAK